MCWGCRAQTTLTSVTVRTTYAGVARDLLWKLKFDRAVAAALPVARACAAVVPIVSNDTLVTYIPTATSRVRQRGYDQAWRIARNVAKYIGRPALPLLARTGAARQVGADAATRRTQLLHAFRPRNMGSLHGAHILLIDDVITTGSSLEAASQVLREAGAIRVDALVFAQAASTGKNGLVSAEKAGIITSVR